MVTNVYLQLWNKNSHLFLYNLIPKSQITFFALNKLKFFIVLLQ